MIIKKFKALFFVVLSIHSAIFGMRNVGSRLGVPSNIASASATPTKIQTPTITLEASQQATQEFLASQKKSEQKQSGGRWTKQKFWKSAGQSAAALGLLAGQQAIQRQAEQEIEAGVKILEKERLGLEKLEEERLKKLDEKFEQADKHRMPVGFKQVSEVYPEIYALFLKIKDDLGIKEHIPFYVDNHNLHPHCAMFYEESVFNPFGHVFIALNKWCIDDYLAEGYKNLIIDGIAHELEHYKQFHNYSGSYHVGLLNYGKFCCGICDERRKLETGADANAADYMHCSKCLQEWQDLAHQSSGYKHNPRDTPYGYFTTEQGYFSPEDLEIYRQRACEDNALCRAHRTKTHLDPKTPLRDFLPMPV